VRIISRLFVLLVVLVVIGAVAAAFTGVAQVPLLSAAFGNAAARDLGEAAPDTAAYDAFVAGHGIQVPSSDANYTFASKHTFSGSVQVDETLTEGQVMAIPEMANAAPGISDVHLRFHQGSAETSAMIDLGVYGYPVSGPVYLRWSVDVKGPKAVRVSISTLELGRITAPADIVAQAESALNDYLAARLVEIDGLDIAAIELREGGITFRGTLPQTYQADPPALGQLP